MRDILAQICAGVSIFAGSFLLFLLQPMIGNFMLPHFGGTATVWIVCLCSFQVLLIVGYAYAHYLVGKFLSLLHVALLFVSALAVIPMVKFAIGASGALASINPILAVVFFLFLTVAVPYVLVGANATLVQAISAKGRGGYRLYSLSNAGSFMGLLAYPLWLEPSFTLDRQLELFAIGLSVYAVFLLLLFCFHGIATPAQRRRSLWVSFRNREYVPWFILSALSCFMLDSISAHLCLDVTPLPLLWCIILALYLASWVIAFTNWGSRIGYCLAPLLIVLVGVSICSFGGVGEDAYLRELKTGLLLLFVGSWFIHSRLYAVRPDIGKLTQYYFVISVGGAVGGVLASIVAPLVFSFVIEYPLALAALFTVAFIFIVDFVLGKIPEQFRFDRRWLIVPALAVGVWAFVRSQATDGVLVRQCRSFYGTVKVKLVGRETHGISRVNTCLSMENNGTTHGLQMADGEWRGIQPTTYYTDIGGGQCIKDHPLRLAGQPLRVAFLGMGIGTLATYGKEGDYFRFFEINPDVARLAADESLFTFLSKSEAKVDVIVDDARKALEREQAANESPYDLIVADVFSGDSIPAHMATKEAVQLYLKRLKENGILAFHLSNWHLGLSPIVKAIGKEFSLYYVGVVNQATSIGYASYWAYFSRKPLPFKFDEEKQPLVDYDAVGDVPLLTDDFHPMIRYIERAPLMSLKMKQSNISVQH